jgi:hypothetical protein
MTASIAAVAGTASIYKSLAPRVYDAKLFLHHASGVSMDALHVVAGVVLQLLLAFVFRSSTARWGPWIGVLALELFNEANDLQVEQWPVLSVQYGESAKDILLTMFLPTLLLLLGRWRPLLFARR